MSYPFIIKVKRLWGSTNGITLWPFIFVLDKSNKTLIEHERIHIKQQERGLIIGFYIKYLYYQWRYGYDKNPYEIEAYEHQDDWKTD